MGRLWVVFAVVVVVLIWAGHDTRNANQRLIDRCGGNNQVQRSTWDGAKLVGVLCKDGRRLP